MKHISLIIIVFLISLNVFAQGEYERFLQNKERAEHGDADAQNKVGFYYYDKKDYTNAVYWWKKAVAQGYASAESWLGYCYEMGLGVGKDLNEAFLLYESAANKNHSGAKRSLGNCYYYGRGCAVNYYKAFDLYKQSADNDDCAAIYKVAQCYESGKGCQKDINQAIRYYAKSVDICQSTVAQKDIERLGGGGYVNNQKPVEQTVITLLSPNTSSSLTYNLRACVKSSSQISNALVIVNGIEVFNSRGISVVNNNGCDFSVDKTLNLNNGNNSIAISVTNAFGTSSESFTVYVTNVGNNNTNRINSEKRIALIIGIANYRNTSKLRNTINDANAMESKLRQCGFYVIKRNDLQTASEIQNVINDFGAQARNSNYDVALFFYAGHGINYDNESWIVPTNANLHCVEQIPNECANAGWIMDATSGVKNRIVIFDACRNLPDLRKCNSMSRDIEGHITPGITSFRKGGGAFVAYACSQGETSGDGPLGGNGIYTGELLKMLDRPNMNILDVFSETATNVHNKTNAMQNPWNTSAFYGKFIFNTQ